MRDTVRNITWWQGAEKFPVTGSVFLAVMKFREDPDGEFFPAEYLTGYADGGKFAFKGECSEAEFSAEQFREEVDEWCYLPL
jgi:hypothetical protein